KIKGTKSLWIWYLFYLRLQKYFSESSSSRHKCTTINQSYFTGISFFFISCLVNMNCSRSLKNNLYARCKNISTVMETVPATLSITEICYFIAVVGACPAMICLVIIQGKKTIHIPHNALTVGSIA